VVQALKHVEYTEIAGKAVHSCDDRLSGSTIMRKLLTLGLASLLLAIPIAASAQEAYTTRTVNVRAGPDTGYPVVSALGAGAPVQVFGCLDDWSWCDVGFGYDRGWVYAPYLNYVYQGRRVPFYTYAPTFGIPISTFSVGSYWDRYYHGRPWYGRRDYWEQRSPVHVRPTGPSPRPFREELDGQRYRTQSSQPGYQGNREAAARDNRFPRDAGTVPQERRGYQGAPGTREGGAPPADRRAYQGAPGGAAPPQNRFPQDARRATPAQQAGAAPAPNKAPQEMRRASPTQQAAPPAVHEGGPPRGGEKNHPAEGDKGHGKEGGKQEEKR